MCRGLSKQQRAILGLGVRINRAVNGGEVVPIRGEPVKRDGFFPDLYSPGLAEITRRYVLHLLYGVPVVREITCSMPYSSVSRYSSGSRYCKKNTGFLAHTRETRTLKASVTRAITSLLAHDFLVNRPARDRWPGDRRPVLDIRFDHSVPRGQEGHKIWVGKEALADWKAKLTEGDELAFTCGYALRPKGIEAGLAHEHDHDLVAVLEGVLALQDADEAKAILKRRIEALRLANMAEELAA